MTSMEASREDIQRWRREKRDDILQYAYMYNYKRGSIGDLYDFPFADLWISPRTGEELCRCPFVRKVRGQDKYLCTIYETRPDACRDYPWHVSHMRSVGCEMLDAGDTDADVAKFMGRSET